MNTKVYVGNLPVATTESELMDMFSNYGNVANVHIAVDRNKPNGFGFVTMATPEGARAAIRALNGKALATGLLTASETPPDKERSGSASERSGPSRPTSCLF